MKKFLSLSILIAVAALFTAGCSSTDGCGVTAGCSASTSKAEGLYNSYVSKYKVELEDMTNAFGGAAGKTSFTEYVQSLDDCNTLTDADAIGMITLMVGPTLVKNGHDVTSFIKDTNRLLTQINKEGLCPTTSNNERE